ncbi:MAG: hypothetical protein RL514_1218 [Verrucomicrobiota bacterium]|jgi:hypothetical protein
MAVLGPPLPDLRRYWSEQGRIHAQNDIGRRRLRLFFVIPPPELIIDGQYPRRAAPLAEFESLLISRQLGVTLMRVAGQGHIGPNYVAMHTRCDFYNAEVELHLREQHGFDIVSMLWRMAEREARSPKHPAPNLREFWLPFAASGTSCCLLVGLVVLRRRRERRLVNC